MNFFTLYAKYLWAGLAVVVIGAGVLFAHHLKQTGVAQQQEADARVEAVQANHVSEVENAAANADAQNSIKLETALVAPAVPAARFVLRVCPSPVDRGNQLPADGGTGRASPGPGGLSSGVGSEDAGSGGTDVAPDTEALLARANAKLKYWQGYYQECRVEGACR